MTVTNANATGTEQNHVLEGLTVRAGLLVVNATGQSSAVNADSTGALRVASGGIVIVNATGQTAALAVDAGSNLLVNGGRQGGTEADYLNGVINAGGAASGSTIRSSHPARATTMSDASNTYSSPGVMHTSAVVCYAGDVIAGMAIRTGAQALVAPTNWWFALYDTNLNLLTQTADQTSTALGASTVKDLNFQATQTITTSGVYYAGLMFAAGTIPGLCGTTLFSALSTGLHAPQKQVAQTSGSALTTTAPGSIATPTVSNTQPYIVLHS